MFYTVYQITNLLDGKIYIGKHQAKNLADGYMGSGKRLRYAIKKYGLENFKKEILFQFETEVDMNAKEAELVNEEFVARSDTYNICFGGQGGFGYLNTTGKSVTISEQRKRDPSLYARAAKLGGQKMKQMLLEDEDFRAEHARKCAPTLNPKSFLGRKHTEETKRKMSVAISAKARGSQNSQFGTMWITNGTENRKIKKDLDIIPEGWYKGRR